MKRINPSDKWLKQVSLGTGIEPSSLKDFVTKHYNQGLSTKQIQNALTLIAKSHGKKLLFVGTKGIN